MVVDTNVFVYALVGASMFRADSLAVLYAPVDILVPGSFRSEFVSALWQYIRRRETTVEQGLRITRFVDEIIEEKLALPYSGSAPAVSRQRRPSPYDAIFAALAEREGTRVVTYDRRFRLAFPELTVSPAEFLAG